MKISKIIYVLVLISILHQGNGLSAQETHLFRFMDSSTGFAIRPEQVQVQTSGEKNTSLTIRKDRVAADGSTTLALQDGTYQLLIQAPGYQEMSTQLMISSSLKRDSIAPTEYVFVLEPLVPPAEIAPEAIRSLLQENISVLVGFVRDERSGMPLEGVKIRTILPEISTISDKRGYFLLSIPVGPESAKVLNADDPDHAYAGHFVTVRVEKSGYTTIEQQNVAIWSRGDTIYTPGMSPGDGISVIDELNFLQQSQQFQDDVSVSPMEQSNEDKITDGAKLAQGIPSTIKVGLNCSPCRTGCGTVYTYSLQDYIKHSLPVEWIASWGSSSDGMNSLKAGAVAIRSYGTSFVYSPINSSYDICGNSCCQNFSTSTTHSNTNSATDATAGYALYSGSNIARSEYSAENNNKGCGNGYTGTGTTWPCIYDPVCINATPNGHGRGMCQWGSYRWSIGSGGNSKKNWQQILSHYYPNYQLSGVGYADVSQGVTVSPSPVVVGANFTVSFTLKELRGAPVTFNKVAVAVHRSDGSYAYDIRIFDNITIAANSTWSQTVSGTFPASYAAGTYQVIVKGNKGDWFNFNGVEGGVNPRSIQVVAAPTDDQYEPNNSLSAAWYPGSNWARQWLSALRGNGIQRDDDWFRMWVSSNYQRVNIDCRFSHAAGDIDIALYNAAGTRLSGSTSVTDNEWIDYTVPTGNAWYYIRVYYGNRGNSYNLWWDGLYSGSSGGTGYLLWTK